MSKPLDDFTFEYEYIPTPDADEQLAQAWDLILALILGDYQIEQNTDSECEPC